MKYTQRHEGNRAPPNRRVIDELAVCDEAHYRQEAPDGRSVKS